MLVVVLLFLIVISGVLDNELFEEGYGCEVVKFIYGVEEMVVIGQFNVIMYGSEVLV